jgi:hypothetical protein
MPRAPPPGTPPYLVKSWMLADWMVEIANEGKYTPMEFIMGTMIANQAILGKALEIEHGGT